MQTLKRKEHKEYKKNINLLSYEEKLIKKLYFNAIENFSQIKFLENPLKTRGSFTSDEFDYCTFICEKRFALEFAKQAENPLLVDIIMDEILNLSIFGTCMTEHRKTWQFKYWQHLCQKKDYLIPGDCGHLIKHHEIMTTVPSEIIESGEGFHPCSFLPLRIRTLFCLYIGIKNDIIQTNSLVNNLKEKSTKEVKKRK